MAAAVGLERDQTNVYKGSISAAAVTLPSLQLLASMIDWEAECYPSHTHTQTHGQQWAHLQCSPLSLIQCLKSAADWSLTSKMRHIKAHWPGNRDGTRETSPVPLEFILSDHTVFTATTAATRNSCVNAAVTQSPQQAESSKFTEIIQDSAATTTTTTTTHAKCGFSVSAVREDTRWGNEQTQRTTPWVTAADDWISGKSSDHWIAYLHTSDLFNKSKRPPLVTDKQTRNSRRKTAGFLLRTWETFNATNNQLIRRDRYHGVYKLAFPAHHGTLNEVQ